jgi:hypothetical protein
MAVFMGAFPVLAGKEEEPRKFARETLDRSEELDASQRRLAVTNEEWAQQQTPMGSMVLVQHREAREHHEDSEAAIRPAPPRDEPAEDVGKRHPSHERRLETRLTYVIAR